MSYQPEGDAKSPDPLLRVVDNIPAKLEPARIRQWLSRLAQNSRFESILTELLQAAAKVARPKAAFKVCRVERARENEIVIGGRAFRGSMLQVNLRKGMQVYPFVATCGREVDAIQSDGTDILKKYVLDFIKTALLMTAIDFTRQFVLQEQGLEQLSTMNPGELESWPIAQQKPLFSLMGDVETAIGVRLTASLGMVPLKSRSGIFFPSEIKFENCQFCPRQRCVGRRAAFSPELAAKFKTQAKGICG